MGIVVKYNILDLSKETGHSEFTQQKISCGYAQSYPEA